MFCLCKQRSGWLMMASIDNAVVRGRLKGEMLLENATLSYQMEQHSTLFSVDDSGKFSNIIFAMSDSDQVDMWRLQMRSC